jgi:very-short-patch-repair endonuclease
MNAIEKRFYDAICDLAKQKVSASVHSEEWEMKIAEYAFYEEEYREEDCSVFSLEMTFPSIPDVIRKNTFNLFVEPQCKVSSYTADFVFTVEGILGAIIKLVIEIDGHDWHEKTKEQAAYDKRRDREIAKSGHIVLRFTGSEIFTNAKKCICEILEIATSLCFEKYTECGMYFYEQEKEMFKEINK